MGALNLKVPVLIVLGCLFLLVELRAQSLEFTVQEEKRPDKKNGFKVSCCLPVWIGLRLLVVACGAFSLQFGVRGLLPQGSTYLHSTNSVPTSPEGPSTQYLRTLVPKTQKGMVLKTRILEYWLLGPSGLVLDTLVFVLAM